MPWTVDASDAELEQHKIEFGGGIHFLLLKLRLL